jgi:hypothetical protein
VSEAAQCIVGPRAGSGKSLRNTVLQISLLPSNHCLQLLPGLYRFRLLLDKLDILLKFSAEIGGIDNLLAVRVARPKRRVTRALQGVVVLARSITACNAPRPSLGLWDVPPVPFGKSDKIGWFEGIKVDFDLKFKR